MSAETLLAAADYLEGTPNLWKSTLPDEISNEYPATCTCVGLALLKQAPDTEDALALLVALGLTPLDAPTNVPNIEDAELTAERTGEDPTEVLERLVLEERIWPVIFAWNDRDETTLEEAVAALRRAAEIRA